MLSPGLHDFAGAAVPAAQRIRLPRALEDRPGLGDRAAGGSLDLDFGARRVYLVLGSPGTAAAMRVLLDGQPIPSRFAGTDVHDGAVDGRPPSASTTWSTCPRSATTSSVSSPNPG